MGRWAGGGIAQLPRALGEDGAPGSSDSSPQGRSSGRPPRPPPLGALSVSAARSRRQGGPSESSGKGASSQAPTAPQHPSPLPQPLLPDSDRERPEASPQPARFGTPRSSWGRHSWSGSGQAHDTPLPEAAASAMGYTNAGTWRDAGAPSDPQWPGAAASLHRWPASSAAGPAALAAACSSDEEEDQPLMRGMLEAGRGGHSFTSGGSGIGALGLARTADGEPRCSSSGRGRVPPFPVAAFASAAPAAGGGPCPLAACGSSFLSQRQRERLRWLWRAVLRPFWPAPAAALAFALGVRALGYWGSVLPGTQAIFIMCWMQCCFGVLSQQGRRTALRLAQLAAALVGVLVLLPRHSAYSSGDLSLRFGVPSGYDEDGGVDGDLPPALSAWGGAWSWGGLLGLLGVDMGALSDGSALSGGAGGLAAAGGAAAGSGLHGGAGAGHAGAGGAGSGGGGGGVQSLAELELHRALMRVQVALGVVLGLWLLQAAVACVVLPAAVAATATAANSAAASTGATGVGSACGSPAVGSPHIAAGGAAGAGGAASGGGAVALKALAAMTPQKSHLDLPALDSYEALQAAGGLGTVFGRRDGSGTGAAWEVLRSYGASAAAAGGGGGCAVCGGPPAPPPGSGAGTPRPVASSSHGAGLRQEGSPGLSSLHGGPAGPHAACCGGGAGAGGVGGLQHQQAAALAAALLTQRLLMWVAVAAQLVAAAALTGMWAVPTERVELSHGVALLSVSRDSDNKRWLYGGPGRSWVAVLTLAAVMAAPLPLPDLLRSRHAVLWHTALLLRPAASRPLGLRLLDCNAAKLIMGAAVGLLFTSWAAAVFSWQLLQVATMVGGLIKLYLDGVRQQVTRQKGPAAALGLGLGCPGASAVSGGGPGYAVQLCGGGTGGVGCNGTGTSNLHGNGISSSCYADAVREAASAAAAAASGLCLANGHGHHAGTTAGGANGHCAGVTNFGHGGVLVNGNGGCPSSADAPCSPIAAGSSGGSSAELVLSRCSSGYSLNSPRCVAAATASGCENHSGYSAGAGGRDVVVSACPPPGLGACATPGASGSGFGGGSAGQAWHGVGAGGGGVGGGGGGAQLARRVLPATSSVPIPSPLSHHGVPPLSPGSGLIGAGGLGAGGAGLVACHSVALGTGAAAVLIGAGGGVNGNGHHHHHHYHAARHVGFADGAAAATGAAGAASSCGAGLAAAAARGRRYGRAALRPWSLLLASLTAFACSLWAILITPPLAVLGDGPGDLYMGVLETPAGSVLLVAVLAAAALSGLGSAVMLAVCAASGELWRRWSSDRLEGRRLQCLAWAAGPAAAVAAASALSWALGDERNVLVFVAAESLHCACLWPLVWLQEPWLLGGVHDVGGCVQHAGCGVTCCVLRWVGLRPGYPRGASTTARCDVPGGGAASGGGGGSSGGGGGGASGVRDGSDAGGGLIVRGQSARRGAWSLQVQVN